MKIFNKWIHKEAEWYHFWLPKSSAVGGSIFGFIILIVLTILISV